jgi:hypothetical protein
MSPRTKVRVAEDIQVYVDTTAMHFFDIDTGRSIYDEGPSADGPIASVTAGAGSG